MQEKFIVRKGGKTVSKCCKNIGLFDFSSSVLTVSCRLAGTTLYFTWAFAERTTRFCSYLSYTKNNRN